MHGIAHYLGGIFGIGVSQAIVEAYRFICDNYNPGDEIIIIGFSRGAFTSQRPTWSLPLSNGNLHHILTSSN